MSSDILKSIIISNEILSKFSEKLYFFMYYLAQICHLQKNCVILCRV